MQTARSRCSAFVRDRLSGNVGNGLAAFGYNYVWSYPRPYAAGSLQGISYDGYVDYYDLA